jgi:hypothetical protein
MAWEPTIEGLLVDWRNRVAAAGAGHYRLATRYRRHNALLGIPVVVFSSVVGTSLFATLNEEKVGGALRIGIGTISVLAAIMAGLQTFLRFAERAEKHVIAADWYAAVRREIDELLALPPDGRGRAKDALDKLRKEISKIGQQSPEIDTHVWDEQAERYGVCERVPSRWAASPPDFVRPEDGS